MKDETISRRTFLSLAAAGAAGAALPAVRGAERTDRPNILWITSEDNSPYLGCYGDRHAATPRLDRFAAEGVLYERAFANAPVCAPARFTLLTGMHASTMGTLNMRSRYAVPGDLESAPRILRRAGYHCTNPGKTDYNFKTEDREHWDRGDYRDRRPGQPFFHVVNITVTHESALHRTKEDLEHDPDEVALPPYHPDTPAIRRGWARYRDRIADMDRRVGAILDRLEEEGLAGETIVFYFSDHGGALCRSKRFLYETGTRVPLIVRTPPRFSSLATGKPGTRAGRIVSFVDFAPTLLGLAGVAIPPYLEGSAFLGPDAGKPPEHARLYRGRMDERFDLMRGLRSGRFRYIRNYMPHRVYGQHLEYLWRAPATRAWEREFREGRCNAAQSTFWRTKPPEELYDVAADPWEVRNLAGDPRHGERLAFFREATGRWLRTARDPGFLPEGELVERCAGRAPRDLVRDEAFPMDRVIGTAEIASSRAVAALPALTVRLKDEEAAVRYWAATGCAVLGSPARAARSGLEAALKDGSADVRIAAAEALVRIGAGERALPALLGELRSAASLSALHAANVLESLGGAASAIQPELASIGSRKDKYFERALQRLRAVRD